MAESMNCFQSIEENWNKFPLLLPYLSRRNPLSIAIKSNDIKAAVTSIQNPSGEGINGIIGDYPWPIHMAVQNNDKDACRLLLRYNCEVNRGDDENYTPLHLAAMSETVEMDIFEDLLASGADVNKLTNMQETPLHFAAQCQEFDKLERLLQKPDLKASLCDCKGENALHNLVSRSDDASEDDLIKEIQLLLERSIDIDAQNKEGATALMLSASCKLIECSIFMLKSGANPFLKDYLGNSFLHCLCNQCSFEDPILDNYFLHVLRTCVDCQILPSHLLNARNLQGDSPFLSVVEFRSAEVVQKCIEYGADLNLQNSLGWSSLFKAVTSKSEEKVNLLFKKGANLNLTDVNGESILHHEFNIEVLRVILENNGSSLVNLKDKNGLAPLHNLIFDNRIEDIGLLIENGADVNITDDFGSTPLHYAVWHGCLTVSQFLEAKDADPLLEDSMGHRPSDVAVSPESRPVCPLFPTLAEQITTTDYTDDETWLYDVDSDESDKDPSDREPDVPSRESLSKAIDKEKSKISVPELLNSSIHGIVQWDDEALRIKKAVISLLEKVFVIVENLDSRFAITLLHTGSSNEGTLISQPNEFDFVCYLDKFSSICTVLDNHYKQVDGYCQVQLNDTECYQMYSEYFESYRMMDSEMVRTRMQWLLKTAFRQGEPWKDTRLYLEEVLDLADKPTFNATVRWVGCRYKDLDINIDIVPAIYIPGYWPSLMDTSSLKLLTEDIKSTGCALLLQNPDGDKHSTDNENTFLRISPVPVEVALFETLPLTVKQSYALAKILLQTDVCPQRHYRSTAGHYISSYMLKTSLMYVLDEQPDILDRASRFTCNDCIFIKELTVQIYRFLHTRTCCGSLNPYFFNSLQNTDIFSFEYKDGLDKNYSRAVNAKMKNRRYFNELILLILDKLVCCGSS